MISYRSYLLEKRILILHILSKGWTLSYKYTQNSLYFHTFSAVSLLSHSTSSADLLYELEVLLNYNDTYISSYIYILSNPNLSYLVISIHHLLSFVLTFSYSHPYHLFSLISHLFSLASHQFSLILTCIHLFSLSYHIFYFKLNYTLFL